MTVMATTVFDYYPFCVLELLPQFHDLLSTWIGWRTPTGLSQFLQHIPQRIALDFR